MSRANVGFIGLEIRAPRWPRPSWGPISMLTSEPSFQFNALSLTNGHKGASASNLGHVDVIHLRSDTRSHRSGLWRPSASAPPTTKV